VNHLSAIRLERPEVGIGRVEDGRKLVIGEVDIAGEIEGAEVKIRGLKYKICKEAISES
jgi:hypothetical protein